jgi:catechol 2,3-dioxygenase
LYARASSRACRDLEDAVGFYERFLGMKVREEIAGHLVFLSRSDVHHELALQRVPAAAQNPGRYDVGLFHVAFEVDDRAGFVEAYDRLVDAGIPVAIVDHRISWAMYFSDPDGNGLEIYWDTRDQPGGVAIWEGRDRPLDLERMREGL